MESRGEFCLKKFSTEDFFEKSSKYGKYIKFTEEAEKLAAQYYNEKYHANIQVPDDSDIFKFAENIQDFISSARKSADDIRVAFLVTNKTSGIINHVTPIIYIKENNKEGILYADSLGSRFAVKSLLIKTLQDKTGISIYLVQDQRQEDSFSCLVDALILGKDATRFDKVNKEFYIPNLLSKLKENSTFENNVNVVLLPAKLLKTPQLPFFIQKHGINRDEIIHKNLTLKEFLQKYPNYVKEKGLKLKDIVEIQFYINQMKVKANGKWNANLENEYITIAKTELSLNTKNPNRLYDLTKKFLSQIVKMEISDLEINSNQFKP